MAAEDETCVADYISLLDGDVIIYPCSSFHDGLDNLS